MAPISPRLTPSIIPALYRAALTLEFGLRIPIEAIYIDRAKTMIFGLMAGTPEAERIMVCTFKDDGEIWLVKRTVEIEV